MTREFPMPSEKNKTASYSIPRTFVPQGKPQASQAEQDTYDRLHNVSCPPDVDRPLWQVCFQGACYGGRSFRNERDGKFMMREHDFVVFNIYEGKYFVTLIEVKSTCDDATSGRVVSNPASIKNNKRSGLHQLRDHVEILENNYNLPKESMHCYLFWPYLTMWTKDPTGKQIRRWNEEASKHVFTDTIMDQNKFNEWYFTNVLSGKSIDKKQFQSLFQRFIVMSCGVFVNEIHEGMLALLTQEQVSLLYRKIPVDGSPTIIHGAAGTGKTLVILQKLQQLYQRGLLNENNRGLYICYWAGIEAEFKNKLEKLKIAKYVDTVRFFISIDCFLEKNRKKYRHIFMDECEAICLALSENIMENTFKRIEECRLDDPDEEYQLNIQDDRSDNRVNDSGFGYIIEDYEIVKKSASGLSLNKVYGEMWFLVDINQAVIYVPKHSPALLTTPHIVLSKVIRNTGTIYKVFSQFYKSPSRKVSELASLYINKMNVGHNIDGPPIYWVNSDDIGEGPDEPDTNNSNTFRSLIKVIIDLCTRKGIKMNDLCAIPFMLTRTYLPDNINNAIAAHFGNDTFHPECVGSAVDFIDKCEPNMFLVSWVLRVKGLEFKVLVIAVEKGDFDAMDGEDRGKIYIMASRCTCLLILVSTESVKNSIDMYNIIQDYPFDAEF